MSTHRQRGCGKNTGKGGYRKGLLRKNQEYAKIIYCVYLCFYENRSHVAERKWDSYKRIGG